MNTTEMIKQLRLETHKGVMECRQALDQAQGDYEIAKQILSSTVSQKESNDRVASKGATHLYVEDNEAILFEINAETDFASKNPHFKALIDKLSKHLIGLDVQNHKDALNSILEDKTVAEHVSYTAGLIQEQLIFRRFYRVKKSYDKSFGSYIHLGGKVSTLVILNQKEDKLAKDLAMQVAAQSPKYLKRDSIDEHTYQFERFIYEKVHGAISNEDFEAYLQSIALYHQPFIKQEEITVGELLKHRNVEVLDFFRFELGQGIEDKLNCRLDIPCDGSKITVTPIY